MFPRYVVTCRRTGYPSLIIHPPYPVVPLVPLLDMGLTTSKNYVIHFYINGKVLYNQNSPDLIPGMAQKGVGNSVDAPPHRGLALAVALSHDLDEAPCSKKP